MPIVARKINQDNWIQTDIANGGDFSADAITNCTKTKGNKLSVWKVDSDEKLDEAVLAIAANHTHLETFEVVMLNTELLYKDGIKCDDSRGPTPVVDLVETHADLTNLSYRKLGTLANHVDDMIKGKRVKTYTIAQQKQILKKAISDKRLTLDGLQKSVREKLYR